MSSEQVKQILLICPSILHPSIQSFKSFSHGCHVNRTSINFSLTLCAARNGFSLAIAPANFPLRGVNSTEEKHWGLRFCYSQLQTPERKQHTCLWGTCPSSLSKISSESESDSEFFPCQRSISLIVSNEHEQRGSPRTAADFTSETGRRPKKWLIWMWKYSAFSF